MKKRNVFCIICGKRLKRYNAKRCRRCYQKFSKITENNPMYNKKRLDIKSGKDSPSYIDGRSLTKVYCITCNKELNNNKSKRCRICYGIIRQKHYYCIDCKIEISNGSKRCLKCNGLSKRTYIKRFCIDCGKEITGHSKKIKRCKRCANIKKIKYRRTYNGKNNPNYNNHILKGRFAGNKNPMFGKSNRGRITKNTIARHHIDLNKQNNRKSNKLILTQGIHTKLHQRAYEYLIKKGLIKKYIEWFFMNKLSRKELNLVKKLNKND